MAAEPSRSKGKEPENVDEVEMPIRPKRTGQIDEPVEGNGIKIYSFTINELHEGNARYWFHSMRKQLELQYAWQAIDHYHAVGASQHHDAMERSDRWHKIDLKADTIMEQGLSSTIVLEIDDLRSAGEKWDYLKERFLKATNSMKAMMLMKMSTWTWNRAKHNQIEGYYELKRMGKEFIEMNGGRSIDLNELLILWYFHGLGDDHATVRDTIMSSDAALEENYVMRKMRDHMQMNQSRESAHRTQQRGPKCYACQGFGHIAAECPNNDKNNRKAGEASGPSRNQSSRRSARSGGRRPQHTRQRGHAVEDEQSTEISSDNEGHGNEFGALAREGSDAMVEYAGFVREEAYQANDDPTKWCFDSGATSMSTGNREIFEQMIPCHGTLTIASGTSMPIKGRGIVKFNLPSGMCARLGGVIYVPGLAENLLSLEALHLAGLESRGSKNGYEILRKGKAVAKGKRTGRTTYLHSVNHVDALLVDARKSKQYARLALSADEQISRKQELIHSRLGHPGRQRFNYCVDCMDMSDLKLDKRDRLLHDNCEICIKAKQVKKQNHSPIPRAKQPLQRVYMDFWGPNREGSGEEKYYLSLIDDYTRYSWLFVTPDRKSENVILTLDVWLKVVERQTGQVLLVIRADNALEFHALEPWCSARGIELEFIEPDTPPQNGVAERFNRIILEVTRALLLDAGVSKYHWKYAVSTANYIRNRTTVVSEDGEKKTPYEMWYGHPPDLTHLRKWGCRVLYYSKPESKLESRVMEATFMMYGKSDRQYYVLPRGGNNLRLVTNPEFRERENGYLGELRSTPLPLMPMTVRSMGKEKPTPTSNPEQAAPRPIIIDNERPSGMMDKPANPLSENMDMNKPSIAQSQGEKCTPTERPMEQEAPAAPLQSRGSQSEIATPDYNRANDLTKHLSDEPREQEASLGPQATQQAPAPTEQPSAEQPEQSVDLPAPRRSARIRQPTERLNESIDQQRGRKRKTEGEDGNDDHPAQRLRANLAQMAVATELLISDHEYEINEQACAAREIAGIKIPRSYNEAINDPIYGSKWKEAILKELTALASFGTWRIIPRKDVQGTVSSTRWVFHIKLGADGRIDRFKARLVARGNEQSDEDFNETFAPVFRLESLRILMAVAIQHGMIAHLLDAHNAFVGSDLDKPNCMEVPEGLQDFDPDVKSGMVLELKKSLYGLRQSANLWHRKVCQFLKKIGFSSITADPSIFTNNRRLIIALYVDDIIIFGKNEAEIEAVKKKLKTFHPMTDGGLVEKLLGIRFSWGKSAVQLDQESYARQILDEFGMADCKSTSMPISPSVQLCSEAEGNARLDQNGHKLFRRLIGRLIFLVVATRPDIAFAVNQLSQYLARPNKIHLTAAKHVLRYIKGTIHYGLTFSAKGRQGLTAYADSAYANSARSRSTTGYAFFLNGTPISWSSKKQSITAQSSTEAEYVAVSEAAKQAIWIRHFLYAIGKGMTYCSSPTTLFEDNQGAIKIADNPVNHPRTKHIAVRYHAIRDHVNNGEIRLEYLSTERMIADGLTKATNHVSQQKLVDGLELCQG